MLKSVCLSHVFFFLNCLQVKTTNELLSFVCKISTYIRKRKNGILLLRILIMSTRGGKKLPFPFNLRKQEREERKGSIEISKTTSLDFSSIKKKNLANIYAIICSFIKKKHHSKYEQ